MRRAVIGVGQVERQRRGDRLFAVEGAHGAKTALVGEFQARGAVLLEKGWRIHRGLLLGLLGGPPDQIALTGERMPRIGSSGKDDDLKRDRPPKPQSCGGGDGRTGWSRR